MFRAVRLLCVEFRNLHNFLEATYAGEIDFVFLDKQEILSILAGQSVSQG